jgi:hypoxanthine-DNA glycosylase
MTARTTGTRTTGTRTTRTATTRARLQGFAPLVTPTSQILILGSMPGAASLAEGGYYAHPRNAFWAILADVTGVAADAPYAARTRGLLDASLALWDVAASCMRAGSLDHAIDDDSVVVNDVAGLLRTHPALRRVCLNGRKAEALFRRHVEDDVADLTLDMRVLPSTSPAHAAVSRDEKCTAWLAALEAPLLDADDGDDDKDQPLPLRLRDG